MKLTLTLEPEPSEAVRAVVLSGLRSHNRLHAPDPGFEPLVLSIREKDEVIAGLVGETGWSWLHVGMLWVAESHRRRGIGRQLLRAAEREATRRDAHGSYLDTFDFQALPFYQREGYVVFGVQEGFPPGHTRYYLRKDLAISATES